MREEERLHLEVVLPAFVHEGPVLKGAIIPLAVLHADVPRHPNDKEGAIDDPGASKGDDAANDDIDVYQGSTVNVHGADENDTAISNVDAA